MYESKKKYNYGTGRRKSSVARVRVYENGTGSIIINGRDIDDYFGLDTLKLIVRQPLVSTNTIGKVDIICTVKGDMHDIGKNLVGMMIEGAGFDVIDLGVDVPADKFIEAMKAKVAEVRTAYDALTDEVKEVLQTRGYFEHLNKAEKAIKKILSEED